MSVGTGAIGYNQNSPKEHPASRKALVLDIQSWSLQQKVVAGFAALGVILLVVALSTLQSLREYAH